MSELTHKDIVEVHGAIKELREAVDSGSSDQKGKIDLINETLDTYEKSNQKLVLEQEEAKGREEELKERIDGLEASLARKSQESGNYRDSDEYKALHRFCKEGLDAEAKQVLRTDTDTQGGFLLTNEMSNEVIKQITEISPMRAIATVRSIGTKSIDYPIRTGIPTAQYEGEAEASEDSISSYGNEQLTTYRLTHTVPVTNDQLMNSSFNMEAEIMGDSGEAFAQAEGRAFVIGNGVKQPEGFLSNTVVQGNTRASGASLSITGDAILRVTGDLKVGYDPMFVFNRQTLALLRTLKGSDGQYLWTPGLSGSVANNLAGFNYTILQDMPEIAANSHSVAFGDFRRAYRVVDRTGLSVIRDEFTQKRRNIIEFTMHMYNTGKVVLPEAIRLIQTDS